MKRALLVGWCVTALAFSFADAQAEQRKRVPRFEDYAVTDIHQGKSAPLVFDSDEQRDGAVYYQAVADGGTNFAGHYAVIALTCGEKCSAVDYLDVRTGRIISGSINNYGWLQVHDSFRDVEFRKGSRLIVFAGKIGKRGVNGWHFYLFEDGKLKKLHTVSTRGDFRKPLSELMQ